MKWCVVGGWKVHGHGTEEPVFFNHTDTELQPLNASERVTLLSYASSTATVRTVVCRSTALQCGTQALR